MGLVHWFGSSGHTCKWCGEDWQIHFVSFKMAACGNIYFSQSLGSILSSLSQKDKEISAHCDFKSTIWKSFTSLLMPVLFARPGCTRLFSLRYKSYIPVPLVFFSAEPLFVILSEGQHGSAAWQGNTVSHSEGSIRPSPGAGLLAEPEKTVKCTIKPGATSNKSAGRDVTYV